MLCVLLYGCETWIITEQDKNKLEAMEVWIWRRLMYVIWTKIKRNSEVLNQVGEKEILLNIIKERSGKCLNVYIC